MEAEYSVISFPFDLFGNPGTGVGSTKIYETLIDLIERSTETLDYDPFIISLLNRVEFVKRDLLTIEDYYNWKSNILNEFEKAKRDERVPIIIGGNHLSILPIYQHYAQKTENKKIGIVIFDAHYDLDREGRKQNIEDHSNFLRLVDRSENIKICHIGSRQNIHLSRLKKYNIKSFPADYIFLNDTKNIGDEILEYLKDVDEIHIDIDFDVFDSSMYPALQSSEPFGISNEFLFKITNRIFESKNITALSFTEYNPLMDNNELSLKRCIKTIYYLIKLHNKKITHKKP